MPEKVILYRKEGVQIENKKFHNDHNGVKKYSYQ